MVKKILLQCGETTAQGDFFRLNGNSNCGKSQGFPEMNFAQILHRRIKKKTDIDSVFIYSSVLIFSSFAI